MCTHTARDILLKAFTADHGMEDIALEYRMILPVINLPRAWAVALLRRKCNLTDHAAASFLADCVREGLFEELSAPHTPHRYEDSLFYRPREEVLNATKGAQTWEELEAFLRRRIVVALPELRERFPTLAWDSDRLELRQTARQCGRLATLNWRVAAAELDDLLQRQYFVFLSDLRHCLVSRGFAPFKNNKEYQNFSIQLDEACRGKTRIQYCAASRIADSISSQVEQADVRGPDVDVVGQDFQASMEEPTGFVGGEDSADWASVTEQFSSQSSMGGEDASTESVSTESEIESESSSSDSSCDFPAEDEVVLMRDRSTVTLATEAAVLELFRDIKMVSVPIGKSVCAVEAAAAEKNVPVVIAEVPWWALDTVFRGSVKTVRSPLRGLQLLSHVYVDRVMEERSDAAGYCEKRGMSLRAHRARRTLQQRFLKLSAYQQLVLHRRLISTRHWVEEFKHTWYAEVVARDAESPYRRLCYELWELRYPGAIIIDVIAKLGRTLVTDEIACLLEESTIAAYASMLHFPDTLRADVLVAFGRTCTPEQLVGVMKNKASAYIAAGHTTSRTTGVFLPKCVQKHFPSVPCGCNVARGHRTLAGISEAVFQNVLEDIKIERNHAVRRVAGGMSLVSCSGGWF